MVTLRLVRYVCIPASAASVFSAFWVGMTSLADNVMDSSTLNKHLKTIRLIV